MWSHICLVVNCCRKLYIKLFRLSVAHKRTNHPLSSQLTRIMYACESRPCDAHITKGKTISNCKTLILGVLLEGKAIAGVLDPTFTALNCNHPVTY